MHNRLVCRHNIDHVINRLNAELNPICHLLALLGGATIVVVSRLRVNDEHNRITIVILAKHEIVPWWWFLSEPKHVGTIVGILIVFNIAMIL